MQIDSHQHFWRLDRGDYGWLTPQLAPIYRDFSPDDLAPVLARHDIARTILVQAAPTVAETEFMLEIASRTPWVAGVVGWVEFTAEDAPETIARLAADRTLVGLRPMVHDIADVDWLARADLAPAIRAMIEHDLVFDALVKPPHLPALRRFIERFPELRIVIDHGAKPDDRPRRRAALARRDAGNRGRRQHHMQAVGARHRGIARLAPGRRAALLRAADRAVRP